MENKKLKIEIPELKLNKKTKQTDLSAIFGKNPKKIKEVVNPIKTVEPTLNERVQVLEAALAEIAVSNLEV